MLTTPHLLVGAALGAQIGLPILTVPVAGASHFVLDWVPHLMGIVEVEDLDKKDVFFVLGDVLLGIAILIFLSQGNPHWKMLWVGAIAAVLPDFHHLAQVLFGPDALKRYDKVHMKFHYKKDMNVLVGMATQIATCGLAIGLIWAKR